MTNSRWAHSSIEAEAASWVAQLDSGLRTDADQIALQEWMARSPKHAAELKRLARLWEDIDLTVQASVSQHRDHASFPSFFSAWFHVRPRQVYAVTTSLIAVIGCAMLATVVLNSEFFAADYRQTYSVATGEHREIELSDGSIVDINTDSVVDVHYSREFRVLRLLKGEAHFDVEHDAKRPFQVYAGQSLVTAVGTAFSVRMDSNDVSVVVTEGRVRLSDVKAQRNSTGRNSGIAEAIVTDRSVITAGQSAAIDVVSREISVIRDASTDRRLAWRDGLLKFQNDSLQHVVSEVARYTPTKIVIGDASIRDMRFSGTFKTGQVTALLGALESSFGIDVEFADDNAIYLTRKPGADIAIE